MKKQFLNENVERYNPTIDFGLTDSQVAKRFDCNLVNNVNCNNLLKQHQSIYLLY